MFFDQTDFSITTFLAYHADSSPFIWSYLLFFTHHVFSCLYTFAFFSPRKWPPVLHFSTSNLNSSINMNLLPHVECTVNLWTTKVWLCRFIYTQIFFFIKCCKCIFFYDSLNIFSLKTYFTVRAQYIIHITQRMCVYQLLCYQ